MCKADEDGKAKLAGNHKFDSLSGHNICPSIIDIILNKQINFLRILGCPMDIIKTNILRLHDAYGLKDKKNYYTFGFYELHSKTC